jgi:hypothetical protein
MLPQPSTWRSEAFAEDLIGEAPPATIFDAATRWTTLLAPLIIVLLSVIFAVVPPLA